MILRYAKVRNNLIVQCKTSLEKIAQECQNFAGWLEKMREYSRTAA